MSAFDIPLSEPCVVSDVYTSACAAIDDLGDGMARLIFYSVQRCPYTGKTERVLQAKIVLSKPALSDLAMLAAAGPRPLLPTELPVLAN